MLTDGGPESRALNGRFTPGHSGNPGGRHKGLAAYIRERTAEGTELVDFVLGLMRNRRQDPGIRLKAAEWLAERGFGRTIPGQDALPPGTSLTIYTLRIGERDADAD